MPERSVFRDEQAQPKASVTLIPKPGQALTEGTVSGIQRLVAGAIPEMRSDAVSVLDGSGRVISAETIVTAPLTGSDALLENYRQQIVAAIGRNHPALRYNLGLSLRHITSLPDPSAKPAPSGQAAPRGNPDFAINVRVTTATRLDDGQRLDLLREIRQAVDFDRGRGDAILFLVGPLSEAGAPALSAAASDKIVTRADALPPATPREIWREYWLLFAAAALALLAGAWLRDRKRRASRRSDDLATFADRLRERLQLAAGDVR